MKYFSYSQYKMWNMCPFRWKLTYLDGYKDDLPNIHLIFGTAIHHVTQTYLTSLFNAGAKHADVLDLRSLLQEKLAEGYNKAREKIIEIYKSDLSLEENYDSFDKFFDTFVSKADMVGFFYDGMKIIEWLKKHRGNHFNLRTEMLVGIEVEVKLQLRKNLGFIAFLDVVIRNKETGQIRIIDLKTSTRGWRSYEKNDVNKTSQLVLYKIFYSKQFKIDSSKITVEFLILKRKLYEDHPYPQKRFQKFLPASGKPTMNKIEKNFETFVDSIYDGNGEVLNNAIFLKIPTPNNCKFCPFNQKKDLCNKLN